MKLSREKIVHLSHLILSHLNQDEEVEFFADPQEIRQQIFQITSEEMKSDEAIDAAVRRKLESQKRVVEGSEDDWTGLLLAHESGPEIAAIERNPVGPGTLGSDEIDEFLEEIAECEPASAGQWLFDYLPTIKSV